MSSLFNDDVVTTTYIKGKYGSNQSRSGNFLEDMTYNALRCKYPNNMILKQYKILGSPVKSLKTGRMRRKSYKVDLFFNNNTIISIKNQETQGTAEQKLIHEQLAIEDMFMNNSHLKRAFIVFSGIGFKVIEEDYRWIPSFKSFREKYSWIEIISYENLLERI